MPEVQEMEGRLPSRRKKKKPNTIRVVDETPRKYTGSICPTNLSQEKERFLQYGILPQFSLRASASHVETLMNKPVGKVSHKYFEQALNILNMVREKFGYADEYYKEAFGERIDLKTASSYLTQYLNEHGLDGHMSIVFSADLDCSARMMWHGPNVKQNRPEARKHTLIIKNSQDNFYLRQRGIICLANHEICTHYLRTLNEGLQPWYSDRKMFNLRSTRTYTFRKVEEGLAALNTILQAKSRYLYAPALLYYVACMAEKMTFKELFQHLEQFIQDPERRWHYVMRVKRHLPDPNDLGGLGKDQCYFEGVMEILQNLDTLELPLIYSGSLCLDETSRVKRLARQDCLKLPNFLQDIEGYRQQLRWIGYINGILPKPQPRRIKAKRSLTTLKSQQGVRPGLREGNSRQSIRPVKTSESVFNAKEAPSNMVLIEGQEQKTPDDSTTTSPTCIPDQSISVENTTSDESSSSSSDRVQQQPQRPPTSLNHCILEKLSNRLSFHDDLVRRVESKLNCAALSLKQSEKLMVGGLKGKRGLAVATPPPSLSYRNASVVSALSPQSSTDSLTLMLGGSSYYMRDAGKYVVQSRPPSQSQMPTQLENLHYSHLQLPLEDMNED